MHATHPRLSHGWILTGGGLLAILAAAVNAEFLLRLGVSVSHLTGDFSRITIQAIRSGDRWSTEATTLAVSIFGFVAGASASGYFIHHPTIDVARPYGRSIFAIGLVLLLAHLGLAWSSPVGCFLAAGACGFQNALATRFRGLILRTTHITGLLTDLGQFLGMRLRGHQVDWWKIATPLFLALAFAIGAASGALLRIHYQQPVLLWCSGAYLTGGVLWSILKRLRRERAGR